ncbi:tRNA (adenosine(37)-N6)-threonylcarbamoyltransferase complex ATPase subunit type 1 TsaE [Candidatus Uhrbacteria bacterium]|nr:tRNA (adenosine(37)-N6)-threonylcarbamoyltransferase complex ATPase subunit type 1 TsaE [Candidatus Uhrbacteria bacterium]
MKTFHTKNAEETQALAAKLVKQWRGGDVIGLVGDLGAGKTTFVQGVAKALGVKRAVRSPTFLRMQVYPVPVIAIRQPAEKQSHGVGIAASSDRGRSPRNDSFKYFVHIDAYRIKNPEELQELGLEDYLGRTDTLIVIEWAERVKKILPRKMRWIRFGYGKREGDRTVSGWYMDNDSLFC